MVGITKRCTTSTVVVVVVVTAAAEGLNIPTTALRVIRRDQRLFSQQHRVLMIDGSPIKKGKQ
jgi:hypothetical protein